MLAMLIGHNVVNVADFDRARGMWLITYDFESGCVMSNCCAVVIKNWYALDREVGLFQITVTRQGNFHLANSHSLASQILFYDWFEVVPDVSQDTSSTATHAWVKTTKNLHICLVVDHYELRSIEPDSWPYVLHNKTSVTA